MSGSFFERDSECVGQKLVHCFEIRYIYLETFKPYLEQIAPVEA